MYDKFAAQQICKIIWWFIEGDFPEYVIEMWYSDDDPHPLSGKRKDSTWTS
jgi:hypothetical protein